MMKLLNKVLAGLLLLSLVIISYPKETKAIRYSDVPTNHWAYYAIQYLAERGIMTGYPDGSFKPGNPLRREETAVLLTRLFGIQGVQSDTPSYKDVTSKDWSYPYIEVIKKTKTMADLTLDDVFKPDAYITRIEFVSIQIRALAMKYFADNIHRDEIQDSIMEFSDYAQIPTWAKGYLTVALRSKTIKGYPDGTFQPNRNLSRAEIAYLLYEMLRDPSPLDSNERYIVTQFYRPDGTVLKAVLSRKMEGALFTYDGITYPNGNVSLFICDIPFNVAKANAKGEYAIRAPLAFFNLGEISMEAYYTEEGSDKTIKYFKGYSAIPFDMFPNWYRNYGYTYNPLTREVIYRTKMARAVNMEYYNKTTGEHLYRKMEESQDFSISSILAVGQNDIDLILRAFDMIWTVTYGITMTVN